MAVLNDWQKITRVISAKPWGDGTDGNATISSDSNTRATVIGTAGQLTVTAGSSAFANGDLVLIQQTQGTGAGQWEINMVASGGGTTSLVMKEANHYTFASGAQIVKIPRYTTATVSAHAVSAFNGSINGVEFICASVSITVSGALNGNGGNGNQGHGAVAGGTGGGFRGGYGTSNGSGNAYCGDGTTGDSTSQYLQMGNGGGGGQYNQNGGGGGGNANAGTSGQNVNSGNPGQGGAAVGTDDLININMGGGGGGGCKDSDKGVSSGGAGGAVVYLVSKDIIVSAGVTVNGGTSPDCADGEGACGGGGAGGSVLLICETATLGTNQITSAAGGAGTTGADGGAGSVGRIAVHHSGEVTGTTNPSFTDITDASLVESGFTPIFINFI